eukprot:3693842-Amphidinium_carterae.2
MQMVNISLRALCKPDAGRLPEIYRQVGRPMHDVTPSHVLKWVYQRFCTGLDFDEKIMPSIANEVLKSVVVRRCSVYELAVKCMAREDCKGHDRCSPMPKAQYNAAQLITQGAGGFVVFL